MKLDVIYNKKVLLELRKGISIIGVDSGIRQGKIYSRGKNDK